MENTIEITTKLWKRSQQSYASTIPKEIMLIKDAPTGDDAVLHWSINPDSGAVEVKFDVEENDDDE